MKKLSIVILSLSICYGCNKEKHFGGPNYFQDDFESYSALSDMLSTDDKLWSFTQKTKSENTIIVDNTKAHTGNKSLKFVAKKSDDDASKCSIAKQNMAYWDGEIIRVTAWYYIEGTLFPDWLFLLDIEEQTAIGAGPGMRLVLVNNQLRVEYKFYEKDILQGHGQEINFPGDQWVQLVWEMKLSQKDEGYVKLWQNGQLIIDSKSKTTLPKDILYSLQGTKGMYSSIELGITANGKDRDITMWVDDIKFERGN